MTVTLWRDGGGVLHVMAFRSMAKTLVHELETAARQLAARPGRHAGA